MKRQSLKQDVPLTPGEHGVLRITGSRVTLDSIIHSFKNGATAEQVQEDFPSLKLAQVYAVIAYYLEHTKAIDDYLVRQSDGAKMVRRRIERGLDAKPLRTRLRRRRAQAVA